MVDIGNFDAEQHEPSSFDLIPQGEYIVAITDSEKKATNAGDGAYINLTLQVLDGPFQGRKLWDMLHIDNPNQKAVQIALGRLSEYCRATNVLRPKDTSELHDIPIVVKVGVRKDKSGQYEDKNIIKSVKWKESTKPNVGALAATKEPADVLGSDDVPF